MFHAALWRHIQTREDFEGVTMCSSMLEASISGYVERERELATLGNVMGMYQIFRTVIHRITSRGYLIPPLSRLPPLLPPLPLPPPTALRRPDVAKLLILYPVGNGRYWSYSKGRSLGCGNTAGHLQWKQRVCLRVFAGQLRLQQRWVDRKSEGREGKTFVRFFILNLIQKCWFWMQILSSFKSQSKAWLDVIWDYLICSSIPLYARKDSSVEMLRFV